MAFEKLYRNTLKNIYRYIYLEYYIANSYLKTKRLIKKFLKRIVSILGLKQFKLPRKNYALTTAVLQAFFRVARFTTELA